jgi:translation initiation factor 4A
MSKTDYQSIDYDDFDEPICEYHNGKLLKGIYDFGFVKPSPIQSKTIKPITDGRDLIAQAQSGSGKTGAFVIGSLTKINTSEKYPQVVILANTRELTMQIKNVASEIGKYLDIEICLCIGGLEGDNTIEKNLIQAEKSQMLICTPGRLNGLIKSNSNLLSKLKMIVFDEADVLLSEDFIDQIKFIFEAFPRKTQVCFFSATSNSSAIQSNKQYILDNPIEIYIRKEQIKVDLIKNYTFDITNEENKFSVLQDIYNDINICQSIIFVNTIKSAIELVKKLRKSKYSVGLIHGQLTHLERMRTMQKFRNTSIRVLVATDIITRGIDIEKVGLIINYEIPRGPGFEEQYLHRVGRTGRFGKLGVAINMISDRYESERCARIARKYGIKFFDLEKLEKISYDLSGVGGYSYIANNDNGNESDNE